MTLQSQAQQLTIQNIGAQGDNNLLQVSLADMSYSSTSPRSLGKELDFTNLYFAQLPPDLNEDHLNNMVEHFGRVISVKILRDSAGRGTGTGFARMESKEVCEQIINHYNGKFILAGSTKPLVVKFANRSSSSRFTRGGGVSGASENSGTSSGSGGNSSGGNPRNLTMAVYLQTTQAPMPFYLPQPPLNRFMAPPPPPPRIMQSAHAQSQAYCIKVDNNRIQSCLVLNNTIQNPRGVPTDMLDHNPNSPEDPSARVLYQDSCWGRSPPI